MKSVRNLAAFAAFLGLAGLAAGCGKDSVSSQVPEGHGTLVVKITDDPIDMARVSHLFVTFDRLYLFPEEAADDSSNDEESADNDSTENDSTEHEGRRPIEVISSPVTFDLVSLSNGLTAALGSANVPEGTYRSVNLIVSNSWLITADGDSFDVTIPSGETRGLKIVTEFTVTSGGVSEIALDFDAAASLHEVPPGSGHFFLRPVIRQLPDERLAASIMGSVFVQTDSGLVLAGSYLVPNPRLSHPGHDRGHGDDDKPGHGPRHGDDRDHGAPNDSTAHRPFIPLTLAWPMIVTARPDSLPDYGDDDAPVAVTVPLDNDNDEGEDHDPSHPNRPHRCATVVGPRGHYVLWRLRRDHTYHLALHLFERAGFEVVSGPAPVLLSGNVGGQDFIIRKISTP